MRKSSGIDIEDPQYMALSNEQRKCLEQAFAAAVKRIGCVECARLDCAQFLRGMAQDMAEDIIGLDWINENSMKEDQSAEPPMEKDGITRVCKHCQEPPPPGTIRFFKHGTDEFL